MTQFVVAPCVVPLAPGSSAHFVLIPWKFSRVLCRTLFL